MSNSPPIHFLDLDWRSAEAQMLLEAGTGESPALARIAPLLDHTFLIRSDWAPGGRFLGARMRIEGRADAMINVIGSGLSLERAMQSCFGEAIERFATFPHGESALHKSTFGEFLAEAPEDIGQLAEVLGKAQGVSKDAVLAGLPARAALSDRAVLIPAEWCLRGATENEALAEPGRPRSIGVAAGASRDDAARRAMLELVERDAVAMWWLGHAPAAPLPLDLMGFAAALGMLASLRQEAHDRQTLLLDITTDLAIPTVAALSVDRDNGNLCCGTATRLTYPAAAEAALFELCQSEIGLALAQAKQDAQREDLLSTDERQMLARADLFRHERFRTRLLPGAPFRMGRVALPPEASGKDIAAHLEGLGIPVYLADIGRPDIAVPVVAAFAPKLQPYPASLHMRARLERQLALAPAATATIPSFSII